MKANIEYAVFGAGWGDQWLGSPGNNLGSGEIFYEGRSLEAARKALARRERMYQRFARQPGNQNASFTFGIFARGPGCQGVWVSLDRFKAIIE